MQFRNPQLIRERTQMAMASVAGPNPYNDGARPTITFNDLRNIDNIGDVKIQCSSVVYIPVPVSVALNVVTFACIKGTAGANAEVVVGDAVDMSGITFYAIARGLSK